MDLHDTGGKGTAIVFLHAATGPWRHVAASASGVHGCRLPLRCVRSRGEGFASDQVGEVAATLDLERFHLVGTAAGAIIAVDYTLSHPERVRSLVVANSLVGVQDADYLDMSAGCGFAAVRQIAGGLPRARTFLPRGERGGHEPLERAHAREAAYRL